jgi:hypothetical protein
MRILRTYPFQQRQPTSIFHHNVGENRVEGIPAEHLQRFPPIAGQVHMVVMVLKRSANHGAHVRFVVYYKYPARTDIPHSCSLRRFRAQRGLCSITAHQQSISS